MPFEVLLTHHPVSPVRTFARLPHWQRLLGIASRAVEQVSTFWRGLFADAKASLDTTALARILRTEATWLPAEGMVRETWEAAVAGPARTLLPTVLAAPVQEAGTVSAAQVGRALDQQLGFTPGLPAVHQAIDLYVGEQIRAVSQTTLLAVRQVLREGWRVNASPTTIARSLEAIIGLTPRQQQQIGRLQARLIAEGTPAAEVRRVVQEATRRGIQQRALVIARTETQQAVALGNHLAVIEQVQRGQLLAEQVRRFWVTSGERGCPEICKPIPGMNPEGVGLYETFATPIGPVWYPTMHPLCRCVVAHRIAA